jgi:peptide/nickel transport system substrate-binding protein
MNKWAMRIIALFAILAFVGTACSKKNNAAPKTTGKKGGTFRVQIDELWWSTSGNGFDPSFEYLATDMDFLTTEFVRPMMGYTDRLSDGSIIKPDAATGPGEYSADHKTVTYHIKPGIKFGPPISRAVTSKDYAYALERVAVPELDSGGYPSYYTASIKDLKPLKKGEYVPTDGIETPDDSTLVLHLTAPYYDFDYRMAMAATAPIPPEIGKCFTKQLEYGQYLISSGPYMIKGIDALDPSSCSAFKKAKPSGFSFSKSMTLVRNPNYDASTDSTDIREALPDSWEISKNTNVKNCFDLVEQNKIDWCDTAVTGEQIQHWQSTPGLQDNIHANYDGSTWYVSMNLTEPPFDDIHVRKALNYALDKEGLTRLRGGPLTGPVGEHMLPPSLTGKLDVGQFDPYGPDHTGDAANLAKAAAEMKQSKYDKNGDGKCDDQSAVPDESRTVCGAKGKAIVVINRNTTPYTTYEPVVQKALEALGMTVRFSEVDGYYGVAGDVGAYPVLGLGGGWGSDWPESGAFFEQIITSGSIADQTFNNSLIGLTSALAKKFKVHYPAAGVPSVDADFKACATMALGDARLNCWLDLDKKISTEIVPWAIYRWGKRPEIFSDAVVGFDWAPAWGELSFAHVGIDSTKQG